uniref:Relaxin family peptide receptor 2 n=1 Tax=Rhipicephalus zambeziensis TaxID=60191 RepID=A0A224Z3A0_9ACAR
MFVTITHSKVGLRSTQQLQDRAIAKRFAFIVGTDFLCWMPIVFIKIIAIAGTKIDETLYAWVAVFLLPVNSALNPVLYTLTTRMFKQQLNRFLENLRQCERVPSYRQSGQSGQSWSSVPTVRGQKKTLVTSLSECTFGKKKNPDRCVLSAEKWHDIAATRQPIMRRKGSGTTGWPEPSERTRKPTRTDTFTSQKPRPDCQLSW